MIKIKFIEPFKHRNETTFRPLLTIPYYEYQEAGLKVVNDMSYDIAIVGQASFTDKTISLQDSIDKGVKFVNEIPGDVILFDGQDSHSLIGTWDVFKNSKAEIMLKNTLLRDKEKYNNPSPNGRTYWQDDDFDIDSAFKIPMYDIKSDKFQKILLSGITWLNTVNYERNIDKIVKDIDVFSMFSHDVGPNLEYQNDISTYYNKHRTNVLNKLSKLDDSSKNYKILVSDDNKISERQYYELLTRSKVVIAPFGYGEMAPRDLIANMYGSVLIKPLMNHLDNPIYNLHKPQTYIPFEYSDNCTMMNEHIHVVLNSHDKYRSTLCHEFCNEFEKTNNTQHILGTLINNITQIKNYSI